MNVGDLNVLIVDDVSTVQKVFSKALREIGVNNIETTDSNLEAWNILNDKLNKSEKIDVVFCDWNMPKGDGIYLLKKIRESNDEKLKWTKFIMVTGSNDKVLEAMDEGANNVIHKPFSRDVISQKLNLIYK